MSNRGGELLSPCFRSPWRTTTVDFTLHHSQRESPRPFEKETTIRTRRRSLARLLTEARRMTPQASPNPSRQHSSTWRPQRTHKHSTADAARGQTHAGADGTRAVLQVENIGLAFPIVSLKICCIQGRSNKPRYFVPKCHSEKLSWKAHTRLPAAFVLSVKLLHEQALLIPFEPF